MLKSLDGSKSLFCKDCSSRFLMILIVPVGGQYDVQTKHIWVTGYSTNFLFPERNLVIPGFQ
jgi:hypothetical protein